MKEIVILSGKGGTGKTTILSSFAVLAERTVLVDCDVDAANLHLLLESEIEERFDFWSGQTASIDQDRCTDCGLCREYCRFEAIRNTTVDHFSCEGCGLCARLCPSGAISMRDNLAGEWYRSRTRFGALFHARLGIGEGNSGKLVALLRREAMDLAESEGVDYLLCDGPPGIGCPVISSLSGADLAVLVTEPSFSGLHDLERVNELCRHFKVPSMVCLNRSDLNEEIGERIEVFCREAGIDLAAKIPYDTTVASSLAQGIPVVEYAQCEAGREIRALWERIRSEQFIFAKREQ